MPGLDEDESTLTIASAEVLQGHLTPVILLSFSPGGTVKPAPMSDQSDMHCETLLSSCFLELNFMHDEGHVCGSAQQNSE